MTCGLCSGSRSSAVFLAISPEAVEEFDLYPGMVMRAEVMGRVFDAEVLSCGCGRSLMVEVPPEVTKGLRFSPGRVLPLRVLDVVPCD